MKLKKNYPSLIALGQVLGVVAYCFLLAGLFTVLGKITPVKPGDEMVLRIGFMLVLFVFSAAITGGLVFGYPAYLLINKKVKEALSILAYSFLYFVVVMGIVIAIAFFCK